MANDARQPRPDLSGGGTLPAPADQMDFFELLRRLEAEDRMEGRRFGRGGRPEQEPARLGQEARLGFAVRDVAAWHPARGDRPATVGVAVIGLIGPEGPLPLHIARWVLDRLANRWFTGGGPEGAGATSDTTFLDFLNMTQHRALALYWRAWADQNPAAQAERGAADRLRVMLRALAGGGEDPIAGLKLGQAAALSHQVLGPERLTSLVSAALGLPVRISEFVGGWNAVPARLMTRLGRAHAVLGRGAALGPRVFTRQSRIELRVGPLGFDDYLSLLPGGRRLAALRLALLHGIGESLDVDLRPILAAAEIPAARLGASRLGRTAWLAPRRAADADDLCLRAVVGLAAEGRGAAS
ncbi:type VI secretion system baseplate subunit TssG [Amaricoccus solimangrovi]|uniref:Type VI secretion system baseplate subunit TssG n=1 Tax=Amaricoccus solimangrovi TaxID=2589815 RepID=A0A501WHU8_9RHOB|nr:type VI secretion system baseplate subunit TssG [Amaricoccus solimangrovi]TPE49099.1 type VI secretion system baseplate subunit TssG [Amaricoccus solimangrovi]